MNVISFRLYNLFFNSLFRHQCKSLLILELEYRIFKWINFNFLAASVISKAMKNAGSLVDWIPVDSPRTSEFFDTDDFSSPGVFRWMDTRRV